MDVKVERFLLTGGAGFLGRFVQAELRRAGAAGDQIIIPRQAECDLTRANHVERLYNKAKPTIVIHLAAQVGGIGANSENPGRFFYANMAMGLNLIEQARRSGLRKFVQLGTVCAYPKYAPVPFREDDLWNGYPEETNAPYGVAKKSLLVMLQGYRAQYGLNGIFLLPVNLYGPHDNFELQSSHVIPGLIRKFVEAQRRADKQVVVWGTGKVSREFLYVEDCARAVVLATQKYDGPDPVNIGAGFEITIAELVEKIRNLVGYSGEIIWDKSRPDGQPRRMLDTSRAKKLFGFEAQISFEDGLRRTIDWYASQTA